MTFTAKDIAQLVQGEVIGNADVVVRDACTIEDGKEGCITFLYDQRYVRYLRETKASVVLLSRSLEIDCETRATLILVENARVAVAALLKMVEEVMNPRKRGIEQPCFISEGTQVPEDAYVGAYAYIGKNVRLGKGVQIYPQVYIGDNVRIGDDCVIYAGAKIYHHCIIGNRSVLQAGAVIGSDGYGYETNSEGFIYKVPQVGNVIIEDDVEIGANSVVERAMLGNTIVGYNTKLGDLVDIAHSVEVGKSSFVCSQVGIAGSTKIGDRCVFGGQVGVSDHVTIEGNSVFAAKSGVIGGHIPSGQYMGNYAMPASVFRRSWAVFRQLPEIKRLVRELQREVGKGTSAL